VSGRTAVALIILAQIAAAAFLMRIAARRWWDYLVVAVLTAALVPPRTLLDRHISRYLPDAIWSDGSESKEQIIYASAASTILLPLISCRPSPSMSSGKPGAPCKLRTGASYS
jgi:hypothetical protein